MSDMDLLAVRQPRIGRNVNLAFIVSFSYDLFQRNNFRLDPTYGQVDLMIFCEKSPKKSPKDAKKSPKNAKKVAKNVAKPTFGHKFIHL
jgi:hypothetical protein